MTGDTTMEGPEIAGRLATAIDAADGSPDDVTVVDEEQGVEPTRDGTFAYALESGDRTVAEVYVSPGRARVEFSAVPDVAAAAGEQAALRVRPKAVQPPRTLVFVESSEEVTPAVDVVAAVAESLE